MGKTELNTDVLMRRKPRGACATAEQSREKKVTSIDLVELPFAAVLR